MQLISGMQLIGGMQLLGDNPPLGDPYWANVILLMNNTSTNNQTNNIFLDSSTNDFSITKNGSPVQGTFSPFAVASNTSYSASINGGSAYFNGSNDYLYAPPNSAFEFGTGDFTVEGWINIKTFGSIYVPLCQNDAVGSSTEDKWFFGYLQDKLVFYAHNQGNLGASIPWYPVLNTWYHIAVTRTNNTMYLFINGVLGSVTTFGNPSTYYLGQNGLAVGATSSPYYTNGNISSLRIVKGTALYTSTFTPSTTPLTAISGTSLLLNFTNSGIFDSSTKNNILTQGTTKVSTAQAKFSPASVVFDGIADYAVPTDRLDLATGDFTVELWFNTNGSGATQTMLVNYNGNALSRNDLQYGIFISGNNLIVAPYQGNTDYEMIFNNSISTGQWYHVALVRSANNFYSFLNGQINANIKNISGSLNFADIFQTWIGGYIEGGVPYNFNGYIQDVRITKGVARYTSSFTPPTQPFLTY